MQFRHLYHTHKKYEPESIVKNDFQKKWEKTKTSYQQLHKHSNQVDLKATEHHSVQWQNQGQ